MTGDITPNIACELVSHEAVVTAAYKDTGNVFTWGVGLTAAAGIDVQRYINRPQAIEYCLQVYVEVLRKRYLPTVLAAFGAHEPTECQLGAALSFHYNTGAIAHTGWIRLFLDGQIAAARGFLENHYTDGSLLKGRREAEAALFFDGKWSNDGTALVYDVDKRTLRPTRPRRVEIADLVRQAVGVPA
jgi:GH24 family phage-related lysozyme (muramidase)